MASLTTAAIGQFDASGPDLTVDDIPILSPTYSVEPKEKFVILNLVLLAGLQLLVALVVIVAIFDVYIPRSSAFVQSVLLHGIARQHLEPDFEEKNEPAKFGYRCLDDGVRRLYVGPERPDLSPRFPSGQYW